MNQNFERKFFITDLFSSADFLTKNFHQIEFENLQAFVNSIGNQFLSLNSKQNIIINVETEIELDDVQKFFESTSANQTQQFEIKVSPDFIIKFHEKISQIPKSNLLCEIIDDQHLFDVLDTDHMREKNSKSKFEFIVPVNYDNWKEIFNLVVELYNKKISRFFDFNIDYISLENLTFKESHELEFRFRDLDPWKYSRSKVNDNLMINSSNEFIKKIYVSEDCKISLTRESLENNEFVLDLLKNIDRTGETIDKNELNAIRQYIDLRKVFPFKKIQNTRLINYYHNFKINASIDELPLTFHLFNGE